VSISTVNSKPLLFDSDILKDIDLSLRDIQTAYQLLDDFWVTEMHHLGQAIDTVHVDRVRVERWVGYKDAFEEAISKWRVRPHPTFLSLPRTYCWMKSPLGRLQTTE